MENIKSSKNSLNRTDIKKWLQDTLVYNIIPVLIIFLTSLNNSFVANGRFPTVQDLILASGAAYGALLASLINLLGKYKSGN